MDDDEEDSFSQASDFEIDTGEIAHVAASGYHLEPGTPVGMQSPNDDDQGASYDEDGMMA